MFKITPRVAWAALSAGILFSSCQKETEVEEIISESNLQMEVTQVPDSLLSSFTAIAKSPSLPENLRDLLINDAVEPSDCGPTEFVAVQNEHINPLLNDLYALFGPAQYVTIFYLYSDLNFYHAYLDRSEDQYFGPSGEYTSLVEKRKK